MTDFNRDLLLLACRHHVTELRIVKFWESVTQIKTVGPDNPVFKKLKTALESPEFQVDYTKLVKFPWRDVRGTMLESTTQESLEFCKAYLQRKDNLRSDRQELAELVVLFLSDNQCNIKIRKPGACSHARFLSKCIYCVKTELLIQQLPYNVDTVIGLAELKEITIFVCCFYAKWYLLSHEAIRAPYMDISAIQTMLR